MLPMTTPDIQRHEAPVFPRRQLLPLRPFFSMGRLSIKRRLPVLICTLLLGVIVASTWGGYRGVRASALEVGRGRLRILTQQLAAMLQQSAAAVTGKTLTAANDSAIRSYLKSPSADAKPRAVALLEQFAPAHDPSAIRVELRKPDYSLALALPEDSLETAESPRSELNQAASDPSFTAVGAFRIVGGAVAYPVVAVVKDDGSKPAGYVVRWRRLASTPDGRKQFLDLMGAGAGLYMGNNQGDLWSDLINVVSQPPVDVRSAADDTHYKRDGGSFVTALGLPITSTPWFVLVEFSDQVMFAQADRFLRRMIVSDLVLLAIGLAGALALSRGITRPLRSLTQAASAIAAGDYSRLVDVRSQDELGLLGNAFNEMTMRVRDSESQLERKVRQRTSQLQFANEGLESFSYSVSHDLRAPLRHINGFSQALLEDYSDSLDEGGKRYLEQLRAASNHMSQLIDDLLRLALVTRAEIRNEDVDLSALSQEIAAQLREMEPGRAASFSIQRTGPARGDRRLLRVVLDNLLGNAWKFSSKREKAEIAFGEEWVRGEPVYFVRDNGAGFDMTYGNKLFGAFQRLHSDSDFEGAGIGLATVHRIILRHGGRVWAASEVGKGATFYFTVGDPADQIAGMNWRGVAEDTACVEDSSLAGDPAEKGEVTLQ